jgi:hypothetical protein
MDATFGMASIFWLLVLILVLLVIMLGMIFYILINVVRQGSGTIITRRVVDVGSGGGDDPIKGTGGGGPDVQAMLRVLSRRLKGFKEEIDQEKEDLSKLKEQS